MLPQPLRPENTHTIVTLPCLVATRPLASPVSCWHSYPDLGFHSKVAPKPLERTNQNAGLKGSHGQVPDGGGRKGVSSFLPLPWTPGCQSAHCEILHSHQEGRAVSLWSLPPGPALVLCDGADLGVTACCPSSQSSSPTCCPHGLRARCRGCMRDRTG